MVETILSYTLKYFYRRVTKRTDTWRGVDMLSKHKGMDDKELLHGTGELPVSDHGRRAAPGTTVDTSGGLAVHVFLGKWSQGFSTSATDFCELAVFGPVGGKSFRAVRHNVLVPLLSCWHPISAVLY